jgi:hypothetical protein
MEIIGGLVFFTLAIVCSSVKFVIEHERLVVFRMGRVMGVRGPGPVVLAPFVDRGIKVDLRLTCINIDDVSLTCSDNGIFCLDAECTVQVEDPYMIVTEISEPYPALEKLLNATLREQAATVSSEELLPCLKRISEATLAKLDSATKVWGLRVRGLDLLNVHVSRRAVQLPGLLHQTIGRSPDLDQSVNAIAGQGAVPEPPMAPVAQPVKTAAAPVAKRPETEVPVLVSERRWATELQTGHVPQQTSPDTVLKQMAAAAQTELALPDAIDGSVPGSKTYSFEPVCEDNEKSLIPIFATPNIRVQGFEGLESIFGTTADLPEASTLTAAEERPEFQASQSALSATLAPAVTGQSTAQCKVCNASLEGLLCFQCWELN